VLRHTDYQVQNYKDHCKKIIGIPFDIQTVLHTEQQLTTPIQWLHCVAALRKVLYDTLSLHLHPSYIYNLENNLINHYGYHKETVNQIHNWDILLLRKLNTNQVSHVVLWLENNYIFHACRSRWTVIELLECLEWEYSNILHSNREK